MAPSRKSSRKLPITRTSSTTLKNNKPIQLTNPTTTTTTSSKVELCSKNSVLNKMDEITTTTTTSSTSVGCTTPKAQKYKIPQISTCPPAPKKRRLSCTFTTTTRTTTPVSFFNPPDLELFFASHLASIYNHVHTHVR